MRLLYLIVVVFIASCSIAKVSYNTTKEGVGIECLGQCDKINYSTNIKEDVKNENTTNSISEPGSLGLLALGMIWIRRNLERKLRNSPSIISDLDKADGYTVSANEGKRNSFEYSKVAA